MVGRDQYGYKERPYYMVEPGAKPSGEHNILESKKPHKLGRFPKLHAAGRTAGAAGKAFSVGSSWRGGNTAKAPVVVGLVTC